MIRKMLLDHSPIDMEGGIPASNSAQDIELRQTASAPCTNEQTTPAGGPDDPWLTLVRQIAGGPFSNDHNIKTLFERRVEKFATNVAQHLIISNLHPDFYRTNCGLVRICRFLHAVVEILRDRPSIYITNFVAALVGAGVLRTGSSTQTGLPAAQKTLFIAVGWLTNLYVPDLSRPKEPFAVVTEGATCFEATFADPDLVRRPLLEVIRKLGDLLPTRTAGGADRHSSQTSDVLNVASLNIATLTKVGNVRIDWTESISSHLDFDTASLDPETGAITPVLKLFRYPSFCYQFAPDATFLNSFLQGWYDESNAPPKFTTRALMREILQSYKLLVLFDVRARSVYQRHREDLTQLLDHDNELDILCLGVSHKGLGLDYRYRPPGLRETFRASSDFPILGPRLLKIEQYIDSIQPNRISSLWRDRRDILRWYTFWAVFFLGSLNLIIAAVQAGLSAEQVRLARKQR
ncbi:hypothetical protein BDW59DRAFT_64532 [Aspergillus cavernicola]|uniref:Uncharacterized protein n=1 Tax=Aspergillus cavernicola TaxID=176166 RepID=A0ABR4J2R3_9EURO